MTDKGLKNKLTGKVQEVSGDVTNNKHQKAEGLLNQTIGKIKEVASDAKDKVEDIVENVKEK